MVIASSKNAEMNICVYMSTLVDRWELNPPSVVNSTMRRVRVPCDCLPVEGHFEKDGLFTLDDSMLTTLKRDDFLDISYVTDEQCSDYIDEYYPCVVMMSKESLETMGVEMKTGEGWRWDPTGRKFDFTGCPDNTRAWNPFLKMWTTKCEKCSRVPYHDKETGCNLTDHISEDNIFDGVFCECDLCPRCKKLVTGGCPDDHRDCM